MAEEEQHQSYGDGSAPNRNAVMHEKGPARRGLHGARFRHYVAGLLWGLAVGFLTNRMGLTEPPTFVAVLAYAFIGVSAAAVCALILAVVTGAVRGRFDGRRWALLVSVIAGFGFGTALGPSGAAAA